MARPLIVSDCDEVLLHMVMPFRAWLEQSQGVEFCWQGGDFMRALKWQESGEVLQPPEIWQMLSGFFDSEMHRQTLIPGAAEALAELADYADVVVLTNLEDKRREDRRAQLRSHGIDVPVYTNQGPKGPALRKILDYYAPSEAIFIDDLAAHMQSAAELVPEVRRLHLCGEPQMAPHIDCAHEAGHAHARIDRWDEALPWLRRQLGESA